MSSSLRVSGSAAAILASGQSRTDLGLRMNFRVVKSRYGSAVGVPGEITVVWDEGRTRFEGAARSRQATL